MASVLNLTMHPEQRMVLGSVSWSFYLRCCDEFEESTTRITYNEGKLEFVIAKAPHEFYKKMLAKLVEMMLFEQRRPVRSGGSLTIQRSDLEKGFEPDECWWLENEARIRGKTELDFRTDPPPDLAIEVEITSSLANRIGIYAAIGVPEIWRFDGQSLRFCVLNSCGTYVDQVTSLAFPKLCPSDLLPFLAFDHHQDETTCLHTFVKWFREQGQY